MFRESWQLGVWTGISQKRNQEILVGPSRFVFTAAKWQMLKVHLKFSPNGDTNSGHVR